MKKTFKTFALMLLTAFAFSSCVDVPAPFELPNNSKSSGGSSSGEEYILNQSFSSSLGDFTSQSESGSLSWKIDYGAAVVTGFADWNGTGTKSNKPGVTYLISSEIDLSGIDNAYVVIEQAINYVKSTMTDDHQLLIRQVGTEAWTELSMDFNGLGSSFTFVSQKVQLPQSFLGQKVQLALKHIAHDSYSSTWEVKSIMVAKGTASDANSGNDNGGSSGEGTGITCAEALEKINTLEDGKSTTETYTVTGYIVDAFTNGGKLCFWMSDTKDGEKFIQAYNATLPQGVTAFQVGMKVAVTGKLKKYVNKNTGAVTPEMENPTVKILEDDGSGSSGSGSSSSDGSQIADFTSGQGSWTVNDANGSGIWTNSSQYGMVASGFINNTSQASESWLISPEIDLTSGTNCKIILYEAINHIKTGSIADQCQVYACINDGQTNWQLLTADKRPAGTGWTYQDDTFDASAFDGKKILLAFKYVSTESSAPSWEIKTVKIKGVESSSQGNDSGNGGNGGGETVTSLVNGGFEDWVDELPTGWKSASSASSSTVSQSTDARNGNYACKVAVPTGTGNARLATQEITLEAGSYTFSYYAKAATAEFAQTKGGHVPVTNGVVGAYTYPKTYTNLSNTEWTFVSYDFELTSTTTVCLLVMNPKTNAQYTAQDILVDDATLVKK